MVAPEPVVWDPAEVQGGGAGGGVLLALDHQVARVVDLLPLPIRPAAPRRVHTHIVLAWGVKIYENREVRTNKNETE